MDAARLVGAGSERRDRPKRECVEDIEAELAHKCKGDVALIEAGASRCAPTTKAPRLERLGYDDREADRASGGRGLGEEFDGATGVFAEIALSRATCDAMEPPTLRGVVEAHRFPADGARLYTTCLFDAIM